MTSQAQKTNDNISTFSPKTKQAALDEELSDIRESMNALKDDLSSLSEAMTKTGVNEFERVKDRVKQSSRELLETTTEISKKNLEPVEKSIKGRPFFAVGTAFGLGFLASLWLKRS